MSSRTAAGLTRPSSSTRRTTPSTPTRVAKSKSDGPAKAKAGSKLGKSAKSAKVEARESALALMGGVKIDVFIRIRPQNAKEAQRNDATIVARDGRDPKTCVLHDRNNEVKRYTLDQVFDAGSSQAGVYERAVVSIVDQVVSGISCAIFAYGQTGAGKTHTMRGSLVDPQQHGIIQRGTLDLIEKLAKKEYTDIRMAASFLEIYNEGLEDLLFGADSGRAKPSAGAPKLMLIDDKKHGCVCNNLSEWEFEDAATVMQLLDVGEKRAKVSATKMNKQSNRAHRIFIIKARFKEYDVEDSATLTFVDLAGSEDIGRSGATGITAKEAGHINKSLLSLGRVIDALAANEKHIPYRDSKLTQLLSEALGGSCKTTFITCVSPAISSHRETEKTVKYAVRAMEAMNISQLPRWKQDQIVIDGLTRRVEALINQLDKQSKAHKNETKALKEENKRLKDNEIEIIMRISKLPALCAQQLVQHEARADGAVKTAAIGLSDDVKQLAADVAGQIKCYTEAIAGLERQRNHWNTRAIRGLQSIRASNGGLVTVMDARVTGVRDCGASIWNVLKTGNEFVLRLTEAHVAESQSQLQGLKVHVSKTTANAVTIVDETSARVASSTEEMADGLQSQSDGHGQGIVRVVANGRLMCDAVATHSGGASARLSDATKATRQFVDADLKRDSQRPPAKEAFQYPDKFAETPSPALTLGDAFAAGLAREDGVQAGRLEPGPGVDYPAQPGAEDWSDPWADQPLESVDATILEAAGIESLDDYDTDQDDADVAVLLWPHLPSVNDGDASSDEETTFVMPVFNRRPPVRNLEDFQALLAPDPRSAEAGPASNENDLNSACDNSSDNSSSDDSDVEDLATLPIEPKPEPQSEGPTLPTSSATFEPVAWGAPFGDPTPQADQTRPQPNAAPPKPPTQTEKVAASKAAQTAQSLGQPGTSTVSQAAAAAAAQLPKQANGPRQTKSSTRRSSKMVRMQRIKGFPLDSVGCKVTTQAGTVAVVRFVGNHAGGKGPRVGIELPTPKGKHNGTVERHSYFECEENHGLLVRPEKLKLVSGLGSSR